MKKYLYSVLFSFALISFSHSVHADDHMQSGPGAIEILSCKFIYEIILCILCKLFLYFPKTSRDKFIFA